MTINVTVAVGPTCSFGSIGYRQVKWFGRVATIPLPATFHQ